MFGREGDLLSAPAPSSPAAEIAIRPKGGYRWLLLACGLGSLGFAAFFAWVSFSGAPDFPIALGAAGSLGFLASGVYCLTFLSRAATLLAPDRITRVGVMGRRTMMRADIAGYRRVQRNNEAPSLAFQSRRAGEKPLRVFMFADQPAFEHWLAGIPDLDAEALARSQAELAADPALGADPAERKARLDRFGKIAKIYNYIQIGLCVWAWLWPRPYDLVIGLLLGAPMVTLILALWGQGALSLGYDKTDARPKVGAMLFFVGCVLMIRAFDVALLQWAAPLTYALLIGAALTAAMIGVDRKLKASRGWLIAAVSASLFGWGAVVEIDSLADPTPTAIYQTTVTDKTVHHGKSTRWTVDLAAWGPAHGGSSMDVSEAAYDAVEVGQTVCVGLHHGALGVPWYELTACGQATVQPAA